MSEQGTLMRSRTIRVPVGVLACRSTRTPSRFQAFVKLASICAPVGDVYSRKDAAVRLRAGQTITTLEELGQLWGETRFTARRTLEAFERDGLLTTQNVEEVPELILPEAPPKTRLKGTLVTLCGFKDEPRLKPQ